MLFFFTAQQHFKYQVILLINKNNLHIIKLIKSCGSCEHIQKSNYLKKKTYMYAIVNIIFNVNQYHKYRQREQEVPTHCFFKSFLHFDLHILNLWIHEMRAFIFARKTLNSVSLMILCERQLVFLYQYFISILNNLIMFFVV